MARIGMLIVAVAVVLGAGCSDDDGAIPEGTTTTRQPTTSSGPTTSSTTSGGAESDVTRRYEAFWDARFAANQAPADPDDLDLPELATGAQLEEVLDETRRNRDEGIAFRRPQDSVYERRVTVISDDGDMARLQDCVTNDGIVYRIDTGEVIDDSVGTSSLEATMRRVDGVWKLESTKLLQHWDGVSGCALAG